MKNYFKEIKTIENEREELVREYKEAEYLFYTSDSIHMKNEMRLNMLDIQSKLDDLKFEEEQANECLMNMVNQGIMIWKYF